MGASAGVKKYIPGTDGDAWQTGQVLAITSRASIDLREERALLG